MKSLLMIQSSLLWYFLTILSMSLLVGALASLYRFFRESRNHNWKLICLFNLGFNFFLFVIFMDCAWYESGVGFGHDYNSFQMMMFDLPWIFYAVSELISLLMLIWVDQNHKHYQDNNLTPDSIRKALNFLPEGILISDRAGTVWLTNLRMGALSRDLTGEILSDADDFWRKLEEQNIGENGQLLVRHNTEVWLFEKSSIEVEGKEFFQTIAGNVTEWYHIIEELHDKSTHLKEVQKRMKEAAELSADMFVAQEQAKARAALHNELGQVLLMGRHYLLHPESNDPKLVYMTTGEMNRFLLGEKVDLEQARGNAMNQSVMMASSIGVTVHLTGTVPNEGQITELLGQLITECAANTVKHAEGDELTVECAESSREYMILVTNNGKPPKKEIAESGGLLSLHRKVEEMGGVMMIESAPVFRMAIRVKK
ncbi:MAG: hypothetical protein J5825_00720 [Lachnospiraceae bacterium]|nr:hypothetical protein [Lachnospiraceae bacterium]